MPPASMNDGMKTPVDLLTRGEYRLSRALLKIGDDAMVLELAGVLSDLAAARMQIESPGAHDKRASARIHERGVVCVECGEGRRFEAALHDISAGGALIECDTPILPGEDCTVKVPGLDQPVAATVRATAHGLTHMAFREIQPEDLITLVKHLDRCFTRY